MLQRVAFLFVVQWHNFYCYMVLILNDLTVLLNVRLMVVLSRLQCVLNRKVLACF